MIKLTLFQLYDDTGSPPVWVNPSQITYMNPTTRKQHGWKDTSGSRTIDRNKRDVPVTIISFAAGIGEEADSVSVLETPEEILRLIRSI